MYKLAILDRDGVVNRPSSAYIKTADEWRPIAGSIEAIAKLSKAGIKVALATNQSAIARGLFDVGALNAMHKKMHDAVELAGGRIDAIFFCPHLPTANCTCRKPKSGMVLDILERFRIPADQAFMVGDHERDIQAAAGANVEAFLVQTGQGLGNKETIKKKFDVPVFQDLAAVVKHTLLVAPASASNPTSLTE
jgi:D-glycero-D-manno-heptose 1,7-bisphosphate phosphatase